MCSLIGTQPDEKFEEIIDREILVGTGSERTVYGVRGCDQYVIKESIPEFARSNFVEWIVWNAIVEMQTERVNQEQNHELKEQFAECVAISNSARFLMMERLNDVPQGTMIEKNTFPSWLNDKKDSSFGFSANKKVKVRDYGNVNFYSVLNTKNSMVHLFTT